MQKNKKNKKKKKKGIKKTESKPEADKNESYSKTIEAGVEGEGKQESQNVGPSKGNAKKRGIKKTGQCGCLSIGARN